MVFFQQNKSKKKENLYTFARTKKMRTSWGKYYMYSL